MLAVDKKQSLAEWLTELSNPKLTVFPGDDAAKVNTREHKATDVIVKRTSVWRSLRGTFLAEDPGRAITRKDLEERRR